MLNIVIATTNKGKVKEFDSLLENVPVHLRSLNEFENIPEVEETGKTFMENAELKAKYYAKKTNCWALADDSGLEVESLNKAPGIFSARYAGKNSTDEENVAKLLKQLEKIKDAKRNARFVCEMAISDETGQIKFTARGICLGDIALKPFGDNGFGYDPVFIPDGYFESFGELSNEIKHQLSHRSKATEKIIKYLSNFLQY